MFISYSLIVRCGCCRSATIRFFPEVWPLHRNPSYTKLLHIRHSCSMEVGHQLSVIGCKESLLACCIIGPGQVPISDEIFIVLYSTCCDFSTGGRGGRGSTMSAGNMLKEFLCLLNKTLFMKPSYISIRGYYFIIPSYISTFVCKTHTSNIQT